LLTICPCLSIKRRKTDFWLPLRYSRSWWLLVNHRFSSQLTSIIIHAFWTPVGSQANKWRHKIIFSYSEFHGTIWRLVIGKSIRQNYVALISVQLKDEVERGLLRRRSSRSTVIWLDCTGTFFPAVCGWDFPFSSLP
jgi:hypothetical protein